MLLSRIVVLVKSNYSLYLFLRNIRHKILSLPYIFQFLKPKPLISNLMIGYSDKLSGWITFDIVPGADYLGNIKNLRLFSSNSLDKVYASHVLEHVSCNDAKCVLKEIYRVLKPGGQILLAVPDIANISRLINLGFEEQGIDIIFGVNRPVKDWNPQHKYGYTKSVLCSLLKENNFDNIQEFKPFLNDTTQLNIENIQISLCLSGVKKWTT